MKKTLLSVIILSLLSISLAVHAEHDNTIVSDNFNESLLILPNEDNTAVVPADTQNQNPAGDTLDINSGSDQVDSTEKMQDTEPVDTRRVDLYILKNGVTFESYPVIENGTLMLPLLELSDHLKTDDCSTNELNQITVTYEDNLFSLTLGSDTATINENAIQLPQKVTLFGDIIYVPMRPLCEGLGFNVEAHSSKNVLTVYVTDPNAAKKQAQNYVNSQGLESETPYLIWVNKEEFTVHVFLGEKGMWEEIYSCPCSIGAANTPTITGTYKFFSLEPRWTYEDFYVGPIMRFYRGYAIHSTLLKYDGSNYNATVGKKLSHGCIRILPEDINWMVSYVPLQTTIHITER